MITCQVSCVTSSYIVQCKLKSHWGLTDPSGRGIGPQTIDPHSTWKLPNLQPPQVSSPLTPGHSYEPLCSCLAAQSSPHDSPPLAAYSLPSLPSTHNQPQERILCSFYFPFPPLSPFPTTYYTFSPDPSKYTFLSSICFFLPPLSKAI